MAYDYTDLAFKLRDFNGTEEFPFTLREFAVLLVLANRADRSTGECYGGYFNLAKDAHMSRSSLQRAIKNLEGLEFMHRDDTLHKRQLPVVKVGRRVHLRRTDLDRWIDQNTY
jgi:DNA-binding MarR family transcriptional regulator